MWPSLVATDASSSGGGRLSGPTPKLIVRLQPGGGSVSPQGGWDAPGNEDDPQLAAEGRDRGRTDGDRAVGADAKDHCRRVSKTGDGVGTVSGPGIARRPDCRKPYDPGSNVNLSTTIALGLDLRRVGRVRLPWSWTGRAR